MLAKLDYIFRNAFYSLKQQRLQSVLITWSLFLGLLFPAVILAYIVYQFDSFESSLMKNAERVLEVKFIEQKKIDDLSNVIRDNRDIQSAIEYTEIKATVGYGKQIEFLSIVGIDQRYIDFYNPAIIKGAFFNHSQEQICIIGQGIMNRFFDINPVGTEIYVQGLPFQVVGVTSSILYENEVLIPIQHFKSFRNESAVRRVYLFKWSSEQSMLSHEVAFNKYLNKYGVSSYQSSKEAKEKDIGRLQTIALILFLVSSFTIVFSGINLTTIIISKLSGDKFEIGILLHHGASKFDLYIKYLLQLFLMSAASSVLIVLTLILVFPILEFSFPIKPSGILWIVITGFAYTFLLSAIIAWSLMRKQIKNLLF